MEEEPKSPRATAPVGQLWNSGDCADLGRSPSRLRVTRENRGSCGDGAQRPASEGGPYKGQDKALGLEGDVFVVDVGAGGGGEFVGGAGVFGLVAGAAAGGSCSGACGHAVTPST